MDVASAELLKNGILGVLLFFAGVTIWKLWSDAKSAAQRHEDALKALNDAHMATLRALTDTQTAALKTLNDQRISDRDAAQAQLLRMNTECVGVLTTVANGMEAEQRAMAELRDAFDRQDGESRPRNRRQ